MRIVPRASRGLASILALATVVNVLAKAPTITSIFPAGGQQGATLEITAADEPDPWPTLAWASHGGIKLEPIKDKKGRYKVTLSKDTPVGPHLVRFYNADGASQPRTFFVGISSEAVEAEPNDKLDDAQFLENLPVTVNGRLDKTGDVDSFSIHVTKGQWIIAQCHAYSLDSPVDPFLHLVDGEGTKVAFSPDTQNVDPLLVHLAETTGIYTLRMAGLVIPYNATARFNGSKHTVYRLTVTTGPFARSSYPAGIERGKTTPIHLVGWNFEGGLDSMAHVISIPGKSTDKLQWVAAPRLACPLPVIMGSLPGVRETEPNNKSGAALKIACPSAIHGRINPADDEDYFIIPAKKGMSLRLRLRASELGSDLDSILRIYDAKGKELARDDDSGEAHDSLLNWNPPADGDYRILVTDLIRSGSPNHFYRLEIDKPHPKFEAALGADRLTLDPGKSVDFKTTLSLKDGFKNPLSLVVRNLPEGVSAQIPAIPEKGGEVTIRMVAEEKAKPANRALEILAIDTSGESPAIREASAPIGLDQAGGKRLINSVGHLWLTVKPKPLEKKKEEKKAG